MKVIGWKGGDCFHLDFLHYLDQIVIPERRSFNRTLIYRIETLNRRFDLSLISPSLSWIDRKEMNNCFYRGYVNEDFSSMVSISTCDGLVSRIDELMIDMCSLV